MCGTSDNRDEIGSLQLLKKLHLIPRALALEMMVVAGSLVLYFNTSWPDDDDAGDDWRQEGAV